MSETCGAHSRTTNQSCQNLAGKGTDHLGEGRCRYHGGATPAKHGLYSKVTRKRLGPRIAEIATRGDLVSLHGELATLKAVLEETLLNNRASIDALRSWHRTTAPAFQVLMETNEASELREAILTLRNAEAARPAELPNVNTIGMLTDKIGRTAERICKISAVCTRQEIEKVLYRMGAIVAEHVDEETNRKIRQAWENIQLEGRR